jgi:beta-glucuronidase
MKLPPVLGYFNYGGIHRDVTLEVHPGAYLVDLAYDATPTAAGGTLHVSGRIAGPEDLACQLEATCAGASSQTPVATGQRFELEVAVPGAEAWCPERPALYPVQISLKGNGETWQRRAFEVGFRTIVARDTHIALNDAPVDFRGICYLYDSPAYGLVMRPEQYEPDLALLRELNVNAIRSHFPFTDDFLSACDRAGIMVWVEIPVYCIDTRMESCREAFTDPDWQALALSMLEEMIRQSRLHPSVCLYGIGNECQLDAPGATEFFRRLATRAKALDPTRPISYACLYGLAGDIAEVVDIVGFNEYWGWYDILFSDELTAAKPAPAQPRTVDLSKLEELLRQQAASYQKPILLTEFGADSIPGYRSGTHQLWSEDYHAQVLQETLALAERYPFVCGTFPFAFSDYRDPSKEINDYWDELNYKGVVDYQRRIKRPFYTLRDAYLRRRTREEDDHL